MGITNHDPGVVLMGATQSSNKQVEDIAGESEAGVAVRKKSDGSLSVAKADGEFLGVSLGRSLSRNGRSAICRKGLAVPLKLTSGFTPTVGTVVYISDTTGLGIASGAGATATNAVYRSGKLVGKGEDWTDKDVALVDFIGGL